MRANTATFASLIGKLEHDLLDQVVPPGGGLTVATMALANRWITTRQLGFLLGFMGQRVLGQYDLALLSAEAAPGPPAVRRGEHPRRRRARWACRSRSFRTWIALHETTHAFEFEAHPWLRPYLASRLERQLALFGSDVRGLGREALRGLGASLRGEAGGEHWMERLMGDEQRRLFRETQAVMSLLEGFSDYVMDEVGRDLVPDVERSSGRVPRAAREADAVRAGDAPADRHGPQARAVQEGRAFVRAIAAARGPAALARLWDGPETLPREGEIEAPERWIARVLDGTIGLADRRTPAAPRDDGRAGPRPGRCPDRHRAQPDPVGPLPVARPRAHPRRGARRAPRDASRSRVSPTARSTTSRSCSAAG